MNTKQLSIFLIVLLSSFIVGLLFSECNVIIKVCSTFFSLIFLWLLWLLSKYSVCDERPFLSSLAQLMIYLLLYYLGAYRLKKLHSNNKNIKKCQKEFLLKLVKSNESTLFGKEHNFSEIRSVEDYMKNVPLSFTNDYSKYLEMICNGEKNVITSLDLYRLVSTSGTTGKATLLPYTIKQYYTAFYYFGCSTFHLLFSTYPGTWRIQKSFRLMYLSKWKYTKAGIKYGPVSSDPDNFKKSTFMCTTPFAGYEIADEKICQYVHLVFALKERKIGILESSFASVVWSAVSALRSNWNDIITDIETGQLSDQLKMEPRIRSSLQSMLKPDPQRANELREIIKSGRKGLFRRIWPTLNAVTCIDTGPFQIYRQHLLADELFGIPIYCPWYASSESLLGLNISPKKICHSEDSDCASFHLLPDVVFYEFIPLDKMHEENPETLLMHEVEVNETYELVLTTLSGLCRYRINDVVRIVKKDGQCPVVEYLYRKGTLLNVRSEKLNADFFYQCLTSTLSSLHLELVEYCCVESPVYSLANGEESIDPPFYIIFIELNASRNLEMDTISKKLDEFLCNDMVYSSYRSTNSIGSPVVYIVKDGTFQKLRMHLLEVTGASPNQLKIPRLLKRQEAICFMRDCKI